MENEQLIAAEDFCLHYKVEQQFIVALSDVGLIQITSVEERMFIDPSQLQQLEKFSRMHYDLNINVEGIEAIAHLLQQIEHMENEMNLLRRRLGVHGSM